MTELPKPLHQNCGNEPKLKFLRRTSIETLRFWSAPANCYTI